VSDAAAAGESAETTISAVSLPPAATVPRSHSTVPGLVSSQAGSEAASS
jgi:hypothetical protein